MTDITHVHAHTYIPVIGSISSSLTPEGSGGPNWRSLSLRPQRHGVDCVCVCVCVYVYVCVEDKLSLWRAVDIEEPWGHRKSTETDRLREWRLSERAEATVREMGKRKLREGWWAGKSLSADRRIKRWSWWFSTAPWLSAALLDAVGRQIP